MTVERDYSFLGPRRSAPDVEPSLKVGIAPTPDFTLMSLSCFVEFLRHAADESDHSRRVYCDWTLLSHSLEKIRASCGFAIEPTGLFGDPRDFDYVVVHGGILHSREPIPQAFYDFVLKAHDAKVPIIGLCSGQFVLAELGLLSGRRCAVHFSHEAAMRSRFPDVIPVTDMPVVHDDPFITCPGGLAAINLAMSLVGQHCGKARVHKVLHYFLADRGFDEMRSSVADEDEMGLSCPDRRVANAIGLMRQQVFDTCRVEDIAYQVGTTKRGLTRLFNRHLRSPPGQYWRNMRLNSAHWMIVNSDRSVTQIAYECGFTDSSHLIRWFKRRYDTTPARLRRLRSDIGVH